MQVLFIISWCESDAKGRVRREASAGSDRMSESTSWESCTVGFRTAFPKRKGRFLLYRTQYSFLWPQDSIRAAEQGNRVRIPDGNRRCMRDVRCSSTKVSHWGRTLRRQSRPAKAGNPAPSASQKTYKKRLARCGTLHLVFAAQKNGCGS